MDRTFVDRDPEYWNIECYGVDATHDGGYIVTCGNGPRRFQSTYTGIATKRLGLSRYRYHHLGRQLWTPTRRMPQHCALTTRASMSSARRTVASPCTSIQARWGGREQEGISVWWSPSLRLGLLEIEKSKSKSDSRAVYYDMRAALLVYRSKSSRVSSMPLLRFCPRPGRKNTTLPSSWEKEHYTDTGNRVLFFHQGRDGQKNTKNFQIYFLVPTAM